MTKSFYQPLAACSHWCALTQPLTGVHSPNLSLVHTHAVNGRTCFEVILTLDFRNGKSEN
jgi:hypothetical protein